MQLSWNLRPFLSDKNEEFKLFRQYEGNFYTAIVYSVEQLLNKTSTPEIKDKSQLLNPNNIEKKDTTALNYFFEE